MRIEEIVSAGYGFRLLKRGEVISRGGEYLSNDGWHPTTNISFKETLAEGVYRVPIEVGDGWELVPEGETIQIGDEVQMFRWGTTWIGATSTVGKKASSDIATSGGEKISAIRRRKPEIKEVNTCAAVEEDQYYVFCTRPAGVFTTKNYPVKGLVAARAAAEFSASNHGTPFSILKVVETCNPEPSK
jgi:hypothetical protein